MDLIQGQLGPYIIKISNHSIYKTNFQKVGSSTPYYQISKRKEKTSQNQNNTLIIIEVLYLTL